MEKLNFNSTVYDTLGYFLPGVILLLAALIVIPDDRLFELSVNVADTVVFLITAYMGGHLLQSSANLLEEKVLVKIAWLRWLSSYPRYNHLSENSTYYSKELREKIKKSIQNLFRLSEKITEKEMLKLCQSFLAVNSVDSNIRTFVAIYGFYRAMTLATLILSITLWLTGQDLVFLLAALLATVLFWFRYKRFREIFADYVYRDFYTFLKSRRNNYA